VTGPTSASLPRSRLGRRSPTHSARRDGVEPSTHQQRHFGLGPFEQHPLDLHFPNVMLSNARQGMRILDSELLRLVNENAVAFEEALAMANDKEAFREASVRTPAALKARETD
jgi:hypothetical protein